MERRKSRESNPVVRTADGSPVVCSKSRKSIPVVHTVIYAEIIIRNILPSESIDAYIFKNIFLPVPYL